MSITFDELEIEPGEGKPHRARRMVAVVGAITVLVAAVAAAAGYAVGRSRVDDAEVAVGEDASDEPTTTDATAAADAVGDDVEAGTVTESVPPMISWGSASASIEGSGGMGYSAFGPLAQELLAERTTDDGFTLRAHLGEVWDEGTETWGPGGWSPAPWCFESGQMRIALAGNGVIDLGTVGWYREPYRGRAVSYVLLGVADAQPRWVVVAQVPEDTASVTVTFADGSSDSVEPQNGIALLTVPGAMPEPVSADEFGYYEPQVPDFDVEIEGGSAAGAVSSGSVGDWNDAEYREACTPPPPTLPDPGVQPDDPEAAETAIAAAMTGLYDFADDVPSDRYVDDPAGVDDAGLAVRDGSMGEQVEGAQPVIEELVFTSPTEAWFRYRIDYPDAAVLLGQRFGIAVLVGETWKITRDTVCQDLSLGGGDCGDWQPVVPPSVLEMQREYEAQFTD